MVYKEGKHYDHILDCELSLEDIFAMKDGILQVLYGLEYSIGNDNTGPFQGRI
jgi:hypothetical protein